MIRETETIVLNRDVPEHGLKAGDVGAVVLIHPAGGFEVEFMTLGGRTVAVTSLQREDVRAVSPAEVPHARTLEKTS